MNRSDNKGRVSGLIPSNKGFVVHYQGYPSSTSRAIQNLRGSESILKEVLFRRASLLSRIPEACYFKGMANYRHFVPVHADIGKRKRKNCSEMEEPYFQRKCGLMDLDLKDVMMLLPPLFSIKYVPKYCNFTLAE
ncbi:unnamed protein product [Dovyalis caffra]|uniref:Maturase K n=1 Tax=Dovyalis caffra TaxID=77055 RepID=A0AAV1QQH1_9ROSI|nr:unnamed protein product [Dovyalis caffra]